MGEIAGSLAAKCSLQLFRQSIFGGVGNSSLLWMWTWSIRGFTLLGRAGNRNKELKGAKTLPRATGSGSWVLILCVFVHIGKFSQNTHVFFLPLLLYKCCSFKALCCQTEQIGPEDECHRKFLEVSC